MKRTTSFKLSDMTLRQIKELQDSLRMSQTELLAIAIDRMYREEIKMSNKQQPIDAAHERVNSTPELEPYDDVIFADWAEGDEHWRWIATAPVAEIIDWVETVKEASES